MAEGDVRMTNVAEAVFRVPTLVGLFVGECPTKVGTLTRVIEETL